MISDFFIKSVLQNIRETLLRTSNPVLKESFTPFPQSVLNDKVKTIFSACALRYKSSGCIIKSLSPVNFVAIRCLHFFK